MLMVLFMIYVTIGELSTLFGDGELPRLFFRWRSSEAKLTRRQRMTAHAINPACASCHRLMDPIGFGLESYDAVGAWRDKDGDVPIDTSGVLPDGKSFQGARDLKQILRGQSAAFTRNLTGKMLTFALGRGLEPYDRRTVEDIVRKMEQNNFRFSTLVMEIVKSKPFEMRSGETGGKG